MAVRLLNGRHRSINCEIKPELTNSFRRRLVALSGDEVLSGSDVPASKLAVETDMHDAAGAQQGSKNAPTRQRILEMVQHADSIR